MCWSTYHKEYSDVHVAEDDITVVKLVQKHGGYSFMNRVRDFFSRQESFVPMYYSMPVNYKIGRRVDKSFTIAYGGLGLGFAWMAHGGLHSIMADNVSVHANQPCVDVDVVDIYINSSIGDSASACRGFSACCRETNQTTCDIDMKHELVLLKCIIPRGSKYVTNEKHDVVSDAIVPVEVLWRHTICDIVDEPKTLVKLAEIQVA